MNYVIDEKVAIEEVLNFASLFSLKPLTKDEVENSNPYLIDAVRKGLVSLHDFEHKSLEYKLSEPIVGEDTSITEIDFRVRIKSEDLARISKGIDVSKNQMLLVHKMRLYLTKLPEGVFSKLSRYDEKVVLEICDFFSN